jgi:CrcB protein
MDRLMPEERDDPAPNRAGPEFPDELVPAALGVSASALVAIFVGGAVGTLLRYLLEVHHPIGQGGFPWPTLTVNLSGSLVIGLVLPLTAHVSRRLALFRPLFVVGFLGGWTTYSTLAVEATLLAKDGHVLTCFVYLAATVAGGIGLVIVGHSAGKKLSPF